MWLPNKLVPIQKNVLPRLPTKHPEAPQRSSCGIDFPVSDPGTPVDEVFEAESGDHVVETYVKTCDLWNEEEVFETEHEQFESELLLDENI